MGKKKKILFAFLVEEIGKTPTLESPLSTARHNRVYLKSSLMPEDTQKEFSDEQMSSNKSPAPNDNCLQQKKLKI